MKKLCEEDRERLMEYVGQEPEMNLFFVGDIENYGLESDTVSVYALPDGEDWDCVLLQYFDMYIVYSQRTHFQAGAAAEFLREREVKCLSGKTELVRQLQPYYPELKLQETYLCSCTKAGMQDAMSGNGPKVTVLPGENSEQAVSVGSRLMRKASPVSGDLPGCAVEIRPVKAEECSEIVELYLEIDEFPFAHDHPEDALKTLQADFANGELTMGVFENGGLAAVARTSGTNTCSAMVVGVATRPDFRKKGYATAVVEALCRRSFAEGKQFLCLFYDNPKAGRIYHRIGFEKIGLYAMLR